MPSSDAIELAKSHHDPIAQVAGWREIAKLCGYYAPERRQVELSADGWRLRSQFEAMTDAELLAITASEADMLAER